MMKKFSLNLLNKLKTKSPNDPDLCPIENQNHNGAKTLSRLPVELIEQILNELIADRPAADSIKDLFALSATCKYLNLILSSDVLYDKVVIRSKRQARSFYKCICSSKNYKKKSANSQTRPSYSVKHIVFLHPVQDFQAAMGHIGHMMTTQSSTPEKSWAESILEIITKLPNLEHLEMREISPNFEFPAHLMNIFPYKVLPRKLISIFMSSEEGWRVGLTDSLLWPFPSYQKLYLHSMTLVVLNYSKYVEDGHGNSSRRNSHPSISALATSPNAPFPLTSPSTPNSSTASYFPPLPSHEIFLSRCKIYPRSRFSINDKFATNLSIDAHSLQTCELQTMFPHLEHLTIGCIENSPEFTESSSLTANLNSGVPPVQFSHKSYAQSGKITTLNNLEPLLFILTSPDSLPVLNSLTIFISQNLVSNLLVALSERVTRNTTLKTCTLILTAKFNDLNHDETTALRNVLDSSALLKECLESFTIKDMTGLVM